MSESTERRRLPLLRQQAHVLCKDYLILLSYTSDKSWTLHKVLKVEENLGGEGSVEKAGKLLLYLEGKYAYLCSQIRSSPVQLFTVNLQEHGRMLVFLIAYFIESQNH